MTFPYIYANASVDADPRLMASVSAAAERLLERLRGVDLLKIGISEYNRRYLASKLDNPRASLQLYVYLLALCIHGREEDPFSLTIVDYGGGSGVFSLLAREFGIGTVIYNDIYDVSCADFCKLSNSVGARPAHVVCGEMEELRTYIGARGLTVDAMCSFDVIEHIYDMEGFIGACGALPGPRLRLVWGSGAIASNPVIRRSLMKKHKQFEYSDRPRVYGHKERDSLGSYMRLRREMISEYAPGLDEQAVTVLARATRGLMKPDIEKCVDEYRNEGRIRYVPNHVSNTCDPVTGNWAERLMEPGWLCDLLGRVGFDTRVVSGYWGGTSRPLRRVAKATLNLLISNIPVLRFRLAPYYVVVAERRPDGR